MIKMGVWSNTVLKIGEVLYHTPIDCLWKSEEYLTAQSQRDDKKEKIK